jgi:hypothetical protein
MDYLPSELVLEIITHLDKASLCEVNHKCCKYKKLSKLCCKHQHILSNHEAINVRAAKNLRELNKSFSFAYEPLYIVVNIGGSFGKLQHRDVIVFNTSLCYNTLKQIHNWCITESTIKRYSSVGLFKERGCAILKLFSIMRANITLIFDNNKMENLIESKILESKSNNFGKFYLYHPKDGFMSSCRKNFYGLMLLK